MLKIKDVMQTNVLKIPPDLSVGAAVQLFQQQMISGAPVVDAEHRVIGILSLSDVASESYRTHGEVMRLQHGEPTDLEVDESKMRYATAREIMNPVVYEVTEDQDVDDVIRFMLMARIHRAVVVRDGAVVGIVSTTDFMRLCLRLMDGS